MTNLQFYQFRIWDFDTEEMIYYDTIFNEERYTETSTFPQYESCPKYHKLNVMKYIIRHDIYNDQIFENDIIQGNLIGFGLPIRGIVKYDEKLSGYILKNKTETPLHLINKIEIIGNIYEDYEFRE